MLSPRTGGENLWMWVSDGMKGFILGLIGLSSGFTVASALFALIATIEPAGPGDPERQKYPLV